MLKDIQELAPAGRDVVRNSIMGYSRAMRAILTATLFVSGLFAALAAADAVGAAEGLDYEDQRATLMRNVEAHAKILKEFAGLKPPSGRVLRAMGDVPRHEFLPEELKPFAYLNRPLPLGFGQNISEPYLIALMTDLAKISADDIVFETGTGAGYHGAILAKLAKRVYSVEIIKPLARQAAKTLSRLGFDNVEVRLGDGYFGWAEHGPYDAMIIKESMAYIPAPLLNQLKPGGRMVVPLGPANGQQYLTLIRKGLNGRIRQRRILPVRFSPLQGGERL